MPLSTNLDIDLLRTFATIADAGTFTRAGERLHRTQSTISLQVKRLEDLLGRQLLERNARMVRLTPEGEVLLSYARQILRTNDEAVSRLREPELAGVVRLGTPEDFATTHLPDVLAAFAKSHPRVALEVTCDLTLNLLARFHEGEFHLVLVKREPQAAAGGVRVWREPLVWVGNDRKVETQYALHLACRRAGAAVGHYLDDGLYTYLGDVRTRPLVRRLDWLVKRLGYGRWWHYADQAGTSPWIGAAWLAFPGHARDQSPQRQRH
ncbi:MAG TPA: LysR family transcriptional regulator, partial [Rhodospirillales bacterium]|nr:LysR family transcriptional regulator [Rhodospirillales bacterium]